MMKSLPPHHAGRGARGRCLRLSVTGRDAYGVPGTASISEAIDEAHENHVLMTRATGTPPRFFRPGTEHLDDVAASLVRELGEIPPATASVADMN